MWGRRLGDPDDLHPGRWVSRRRSPDPRRRAYPAGVILPGDERALMEQPVQPYIGLDLGEAEALAAQESRRIRVLDSLARASTSRPDAVTRERGARREWLRGRCRRRIGAALLHPVTTTPERSDPALLMAAITVIDGEP